MPRVTSSPARKPRRRRALAAAAVFVGVAGAWVAVVGACSTSAKLVGNGGECFQAVDCEQGLVCAPDKSGKKRTCTSDLSGVQTNLPGGGDATVDGAAADAPMTSDGPADNVVPPTDTFVPADTSPPVD
jgi:hypothetical protein